jgi:hypothetical protein
MAGIMAIPEAFLKKQGVKNPKIVIYGTAAIVVAVIAIVIVNKIKKSKQGSQTSAKTYEQMSDELNSITIREGNLSISEGEAVIISQNLLNAMDRIGTDEDSIVDNISKVNTKEDLLLIIQKFGIKPYDGWGLADTFLSTKLAATMKNLTGWIRAEKLSTANLNKVKAVYDSVGVPF